MWAAPGDKQIPFEDFADRLIQTTGLKWKTPDATHARSSLHWAIERMVISILGDFGAVKREKKEEKFDSYSIRRLHAFTITHLGRDLLEAIAGGPI
jgi:hypothetical protein